LTRSGGRRPPLRRIHGDGIYEQDQRARSSLVHHQSRTTEEIVDSLRPDARRPLLVKADGPIFDGNTRVKVLEERGYPVNDLPRKTIE
jgi:hypothetical protein